jgi:uncharacterized protein YdaU (DUF1376 family)
MPSRPHYPWYPTDYEQATKGLSDDADLLYRRMLDLLWISGGRLEVTPDLARSYAKVTRYHLRKFRRCWSEVSPFFDNDGSYLTNKKMSEIVATVSAKSDSARRSVERRWRRNDTNVLMLHDTNVRNIEDANGYERNTNQNHNISKPDKDVDKSEQKENLGPKLDKDNALKKGFDWTKIAPPEPGDTKAVNKLSQLLGMRMNKGESYSAFHVRLKDRLQVNKNNSSS